MIQLSTTSHPQYLNEININLIKFNLPYKLQNTYNKDQLKIL